MSTNKKITVTFALTLAAVLAVGVARYYFLPKTHFTLEQRNFLRAKGNPKASVWIVEYLDFQCSICRETTKTLKNYLSTHGSESYFQLRYYPLNKHRYGLKTAIYAECAARQGQFWPYHDILFEKQEEWGTAAPENVDALLTGYAKAIPASMKPYLACVENPETKETIFQEIQAAKKAGVSGTPTFFINGEMAVGPAALDEALKRGEAKK